jgi:electron transfer flavoprotein alpha/beta subunit
VNGLPRNSTPAFDQVTVERRIEGLPERVFEVLLPAVVADANELVLAR